MGLKYTLAFIQAPLYILASGIKLSLFPFSPADVLSFGEHKFISVVFCMNKLIKIAAYGFALWIVPFIASFPFVDAQGNYTIPETFFKSIMVVAGAATGVILSVSYYAGVKRNFFGEGVVIGVVWLAINLSLDLVMVYAGFFRMTPAQYFTDIGLRYLCIPIYTIGMGYALKQK
jgi:hypothetical protein